MDSGETNRKQKPGGLANLSNQKSVLYRWSASRMLEAEISVTIQSDPASPDGENQSFRPGQSQNVFLSLRIHARSGSPWVS